MIELVGAKISLDKLAPRYNTQINRGVSYFDKESENIFNFLNLKNQVLVDGIFQINNTIYSTEEGNNLLAFKVNSQVLSVLCVFQFNEEFTFKSLRLFKKDLIDLREINIETDEGKIEKVDKIFDVLNKYKPLYITLDQNDTTNQELASHIDEKLHEAKDNIEYICVLNKITELKNEGEEAREPEILQEKGNVFFEILGPTEEELKEAEKEKPKHKSKDKNGEKKSSTDKFIINGETYERYNREFARFTKDYEHPLTKKDSSGVEKPTLLGRLVQNQYLDFTFRFIKTLNWYLFFGALFGLMTSGGALVISKLTANGAAGDPTILAIGIIFNVLGLLLTLYSTASLYAGVKRRIDNIGKKLITISFFVLFETLCTVIAFLLVYIFDKKLSIFPSKGFPLDSLVYFIISCIMLIVICVLVPFTSTGYVKIRNMIFKDKPQKETEKEGE